MSEVVLTESALQFITEPPDDEHIDALAGAGIYLPSVASTQELCEGRSALEVGVNYANLAQAATDLEIRLPIAYDLTTSTATTKPTIRLDRQAPSSHVKLPLCLEYSSGQTKLQRDTDTKFWLSALASMHAARKSPRRPFDLEQPLSIRQRRNASLLTISTIVGEFTPLIVPMSEGLGIATILALGAGGLISARRLLSVVPVAGELERRSDRSAARNLKNPILQRKAGHLAAAYPVFELQV